MGIHTRVGLAAGTIGFALLYLAQPFVGAAATVLALVVGLLAGLGTAKWLPRDWYGRQFEAGARAGVLACAVALVGFLVSLLLAGAHTTGQLAARSHFMGINLSGVVRALGVVGWFGAGLALALVALAAGTGVAAVASQLGAWDKNRHAIEVVKRAREAAQRSGRLAGAVSRTKPSLPSLPGLRATLPPLPGVQADPLGAKSTPTPTPSWPSLPEATPSDRDLAGDDLAGLNESWHSLRSPLNVFPPPNASEKPWSRYDDRLPPGALLPDDLAPDEPDGHDTAPLSGASGPTGAAGVNGTEGMNGAAAGAGPAAWDDTIWREPAGWMDYEDGGAGASSQPELDPAQQAGTPPPDAGTWDATDAAGGSGEAGEADQGEVDQGEPDESDDGEEADNWLN